MTIIIGPYELFKKYSGREFAGVTIGQLVAEPEKVIDRRALCEHGFSDEQLQEIKKTLLMNAELEHFEIRRSGVPDDWRWGTDECHEQLSDEILENVKFCIENVNAELMRMLRADPKMFYNLSPRKFEEVVAEMLTKMGYKISFTPISRDGGVDIFAAKSDLAGNFLYFVQCKRNSPNNKVGVAIVRELFGVVNDKKANGGIVATTSYFSKPAIEFQQRNPYTMSLKDFNSLTQWLKALRY